MSVVSRAPSPDAPTAGAASPHARAAERSAGPGAVWFGATATLLAGVAPILLMAVTPLSEAASPVWVWAWALAGVAGLRYSWLVADGSRRLFELVFWLFTYVFFGLAPLVQMRTGRYPETTPGVDTDLNGAAMTVVAVGVAAFAVGLLVAGRKRSLVVRDRTATLLPHRVFVLTAVALLFTVFYVAQLGIGPLFATRLERSTAENLSWPDPAVGVAIKAAATLPLVIVFAALVRLRGTRPHGHRFALTALAVLVLLVLLVLVNPISSPRYFVGTSALAVITALGATATAARTRSFAVLLAVGLVLVFPYAAFARVPGEESTGAGRGGPSRVLASADFDAVDQVNNTVAYVRAEGVTGGQQLAGAALFWVPREVWNTKPDDTGTVLADFRGYSFDNLSAPLWAELYIDGGWALLIGGMGLLGWALRRLDERSLLQAGPLEGSGVLALVLPFYLVLVLRGSLLQSMAGLAVLVVCGLFVTGRSKRQPATGR